MGPYVSVKMLPRSELVMSFEAMRTVLRVKEERQKDHGCRLEYSTTSSSCSCEEAVKG